MFKMCGKLRTATRGDPHCERYMRRFTDTKRDPGSRFMKRTSRLNRSSFKRIKSDANGWKGRRTTCVCLDCVSVRLTCRSGSKSKMPVERELFVSELKGCMRPRVVELCIGDEAEEVRL